MTSRLLPQHEGMLRESGISPEVIAERGYRSPETKDELIHLGFSHAQCLLPGLLIPIHGVTGEVVSHQLRPDQPRRYNRKLWMRI